jgi:hypothetical protein
VPAHHGVARSGEEFGEEVEDGLVVEVGAGVRGGDEGLETGLAEADVVLAEPGEVGFEGGLAELNVVDVDEGAGWVGGDDECALVGAAGGEEGKRE